MFGVLAASGLRSLTNKDPGAVLVLAVPGNRLLDAEVGLTLVQLVDQLHLSQRAADTTETLSQGSGPRTSLRQAESGRNQTQQNISALSLCKTPVTYLAP